MSEHFDFNTTVEWCGYTIARTRECGGSEDLSNPRYVVIERGCNAIPGAMFFSTPEQASKAIAAVELAKMLVPVVEYNEPGYDRFDKANNAAHAKRGHAYHMFMKLAL